jgi:Flp pilus assembly protein TadD
MTWNLTVLVVLAGVAGCTALPEFPITDSRHEQQGKGQPDDLFNLARDVEANGGGETALALYREAVDRSGNTPAAYVQLGDAYMRANMLGKAVEAYRAALAKEPDNADALLGLGTVLVRQGALQNGLTALKKAAPLVNTGRAYNRLGVTQTMAGEFSEAQKTFEKGLAVAPDDLDIATNLALAEALAGKSDDAATLAGQIARSPSVKPVHRRNLVIVLGIIGRSADDARTVAPADIPKTEFEALFGRAASIRRIADPKARARALGTMQG